MPNVLHSTYGPNPTAPHRIPTSRALGAPILCSLLQADDEKKEDVVNTSLQAPRVFCTGKEGPGQTPPQEGQDSTHLTEL